MGLGSIAQKAYLPILGRAADWTLVGGFRPISKKPSRCATATVWPVSPVWTAWPNSATRSLFTAAPRAIFSVIGELLNRGVHVYVDKPLAETLEQGEQLLEQAERRGKTLMVGFNRRFAPLYRQLKQQMNQPASIRMDKHRADSVGPCTICFTLLDDYLHVVDTALWLAGGREQLLSGSLRANAAGEMLYAEHHFACGDTQVTTSMHAAAAASAKACRR
ncbi:Gfo/Idh/MocA family oxidoreductase [Serratia ureilytica]